MADLISIIVPVYNIATDLPRCLDSILSQTYQEIEVIAVNDGSSDDSGKILDRYASLHPNLRAIHKENGGVTSARLRGILEASGDWIGVVDGDDFIEPDMYQRLLKNALDNHAQISHCGYRMVFPDGRINFFHNSGTFEVHNRTEALRELLSGERIEPGLWNKLFHRSLFIGLSMPEEIRINEDLLMNYYLFSAAATSVYDDWCPYHYIVRNTSASRAKLNPHKIYDPIRVKEIIRQSVPEDMKPDAHRAYLNTCINTYHTLLFAGIEHLADLKKVRTILAKESHRFSLLGTKRKLMAQLITTYPWLYKPVYGIYRRYFQVDHYS